MRLEQRFRRESNIRQPKLQQSSTLFQTITLFIHPLLRQGIRGQAWLPTPRDQHRSQFPVTALLQKAPQQLLFAVRILPRVNARLHMQLNCKLPDRPLRSSLRPDSFPQLPRPRCPVPQLRRLPPGTKKEKPPSRRMSTHNPTSSQEDGQSFFKYPNCLHLKHYIFASLAADWHNKA